MHKEKEKGGRGLLLWGILVVLGIVALDHGSKVWVLQMKEHLPHAVTSFLNLVFVRNRGISFGLFPAGSPGQVLLLSALSFAITVGVGVWYARSPQGWVKVGLLLILGGALGNLLDRLLWGSVVDFIDCFLYGVHFPAFNFADCCITFGAGLVFWSQIMEKSGKRV